MKMFTVLKITLSAFRGKKKNLYLYIHSSHFESCLKINSRRPYCGASDINPCSLCQYFYLSYFIGTDIFLDAAHTMTYKFNLVSFVLLFKIN